MAARDFDNALSFGQMGETLIAKFIRKRRGASILPVYEKEIDNGKGPRLFTPDSQLVAPDMFVVSRMEWVEAKHKSVFSWYRKGKYWVTGIDRHHYEQYLKVQEETGCKTWLFFLHRCSTPAAIDRQYDCCPEQCPTGLYARSLDVLNNHISHPSPDGTMVYWAEETLRKYATLEEMEALELEDQNH